MLIWTTPSCSFLTDYQYQLLETLNLSASTFELGGRESAALPDGQRVVDLMRCPFFISSYVFFWKKVLYNGFFLLLFFVFWNLCECPLHIIYIFTHKNSNKRSTPPIEVRREVVYDSITLTGKKAQRLNYAQFFFIIFQIHINFSKNLHIIQVDEISKKKFNKEIYLNMVWYHIKL